MRDKAKEMHSNLYDEMCSIDIIAPIKADLMSGRLKMDIDGTITQTFSIVPEKPWIHSSFSKNRDCGFWMDILFNYYKIIPRGCRNCWKLAMRPKTLREMFAIHAFQQSMPDQPAKAGLEKRGYTGAKGGYGAFWYSKLTGGLKKARELHTKISGKLSKIVPDHGLVLKRGCTEMEDLTLKTGKGGSEDWDKDAEYYDKSEDLIKTIFIQNDLATVNYLAQPWFFINHVKRQWIEHAFEHGDLTYLEYTGGRPLQPPLNLYHDSNHRHYNYKSTFIKETDDSTSDSTTDDGTNNPEFAPTGNASDSDNGGRLSVV